MEYAYVTHIYTLCLKKVSTFKLSVNSSYILTDFIFFASLKPYEIVDRRPGSGWPRMHAQKKTFRRSMI